MLSSAKDMMIRASMETLGVMKYAISSAGVPVFAACDQVICICTLAVVYSVVLVDNVPVND
jgi:hypothetical protein